MRRVPSRRPGSVREPLPQAGVVLVVYDPVYAHEAAEIEKNVRGCFSGWCDKHEWHQWTYDHEKQTLSAAAEVACDDMDQITTGLMYLAWDAIEHYSKVLVFLEGAAWEEPFHRGDEDDYREYVEETRLPAEEMVADDFANDGRVSEGRDHLLECVRQAEAQHRFGAPWSEELLDYYRNALLAFDSRHS